MRRGTRLGAALIACAFAAFACDSGSDGDGGSTLTSSAECGRYCQKSDACTPNADHAKCMQACSQISLGKGCIDASVAVDCTEFNKDLSQSPTWADACFPPCSNEGHVACNGDSATVCSSGRQMTSTCNFVCGVNGSNFTGTCSASYQGQSCSNGSECCWCA